MFNKQFHKTAVKQQIVRTELQTDFYAI